MVVVAYDHATVEKFGSYLADVVISGAAYYFLKRPNKKTTTVVAQSLMLTIGAALIFGFDISHILTQAASIPAIAGIDISRSKSLEQITNNALNLR